MDNADAPLGHHWEDSSHITFGVATLGAVWRNVKLEGSVFTGREPNENRYDFDEPRFDSVSARLSWNPTRNLALQVSHGYLHSPEALEPESNQHRASFSAIYNQPLGENSNWSTSFVWGQVRNTGTRAPHRDRLSTRPRYHLRALGSSSDSRNGPCARPSPTARQSSTGKSRREK